MQLGQEDIMPLMELGTGKVARLLLWSVGDLCRASRNESIAGGVSRTARMDKCFFLSWLRAQM